jgi:hypothetical protein
MNKQYKIFDWIYAEMFGGEVFNSFEDAWEAICSVVDESEYEEYVVLEVDEFGNR